MPTLKDFFLLLNHVKTKRSQTEGKRLKIWNKKVPQLHVLSRNFLFFNLFALLGDRQATCKLIINVISAIVFYYVKCLFLYN